MSYSRRNFLKAAGSGVVLTAVGGERSLSSRQLPLALAAPMTKEKAHIPDQRKAARRRIRSTHHSVGSDRDQAGPDRNEPKLQSGQLRRVQRAGGRNPRLFLPHPGDRSRGQEDSHHRRRGRSRRTCTRCSASATRTWPPIAASAPPDGWSPRKRCWTRIPIRPRMR